MVAELYQWVWRALTGRHASPLSGGLGAAQSGIHGNSLSSEPDPGLALPTDDRWWRTVSGTVSVTANQARDAVAAQTFTGLLNDYRRLYYTATQAAIYNNMVYGTNLGRAGYYTPSVVDDTPTVAPARGHWKERMAWLKREKLEEK